MKIVIDDLPWVKDLTWNHCRMGPGGNWNLKDHVQAWCERLSWDLFAEWCKAGRPELEATAKHPIHVLVHYRFPDLAERDAENYFYVIANGVASGLRLKNDQHVRTKAGSIVVDRKNPGFAIEVYDDNQEPDHPDLHDDLASLD